MHRWENDKTATLLGDPLDVVGAAAAHCRRGGSFSVDPTATDEESCARERVELSNHQGRGVLSPRKLSMKATATAGHSLA